jgi:hypothetical protein
MRRGKQITAQKVLLALMENRPPDPVATLLGTLGVDVAAVRKRLSDRPAG